MTWIADLSHSAYVVSGPSIRAIGWLDRAHPFPSGSVPSHFARALETFARLARESEAVWGFAAVHGLHTCELCQPSETVPAESLGGHTFAVPFGNLLFVCPQLVAHYVSAHGYTPPDSFIAAVLESPLPDSGAYARQAGPILTHARRFAELMRRAQADVGGPSATVVMGVAAAGKTTIAELLAERRRAACFDADDFHSPASVAKMRRGEALSEADRAPWLTELNQVLALQAREKRPVVLACSALRQIHRSHLVAGIAGARFVYLRADRELLAPRLAARRDHFFPAALLDSQLAALEEPADAIVIDAALPPSEIVARIEAAPR